MKRSNFLATLSAIFLAPFGIRAKPKDCVEQFVPYHITHFTMDGRRCEINVVQDNVHKEPLNIRVYTYCDGEWRVSK